MTWRTPAENSVTIDESINLASFGLGDLSVEQRSEKLSSGVYSRLTLTLVLERSIGFYVIQIYLPSMLVVVISWVSFWVTRESAPARVTLGVTTVLTITTLITTTNQAMPPVSYVKAVDIYLSVCYFFVFAALFEFALVSYSGKQNKGKSGGRSRRSQGGGPPRPLKTSLNLKSEETSPAEDIPASGVCTCHNNLSDPSFNHQLNPSSPALRSNPSSTQSIIPCNHQLNPSSPILRSVAMNCRDFDDNKSMLINGAGDGGIHRHRQQSEQLVSKRQKPFHRHSCQQRTTTILCETTELNTCGDGEYRQIVIRRKCSKPPPNADDDCRNDQQFEKHVTSKKMSHRNSSSGGRRTFCCCRNKRGFIIACDAAAVDQYSRFLFPLMFLLFNAAYWSIFLVQRSVARNSSNADATGNKSYGIL